MSKDKTEPFNGHLWKLLVKQLFILKEVNKGKEGFYLLFLYEIFLKVTTQLMRAIFLYKNIPASERGRNDKVSLLPILQPQVN